MSKDKQFIISGDKKKADVINTNAIIHHDNVIPGFYNVRSILGSAVCNVADISLPKGSELTAKLILDMKEISNVFSERSLKIHEQLGAKAKIGYILEGPQGTGKTTAMLSAADYLIKQMNACVFIVEDSSDFSAAISVIKRFREVTPDMLAVVIMDECEDSMKRNESNMKRHLDGTDTPTKFLFFGATNYIEQIPSAIKNRPSRIKHVFKCADLLQEEEIVWSMVNNMNINLSDDVRMAEEAVKAYIPNLKGKTIDEIKHFFLDKLLDMAPTDKKPKTKKKSGTPACEELS